MERYSMATTMSIPNMPTSVVGSNEASLGNTARAGTSAGADAMAAAAAATGHYFSDMGAFSAMSSSYDMGGTPGVSSSGLGGGYGSSGSPMTTTSSLGMNTLQEAGGDTRVVNSAQNASSYLTSSGNEYQIAQPMHYQAFNNSSGMPTSANSSSHHPSSLVYPELNSFLVAQDPLSQRRDLNSSEVMYPYQNNLGNLNQFGYGGERTFQDGDDRSQSLAYENQSNMQASMFPHNNAPVRRNDRIAAMTSSNPFDMTFRRNEGAGNVSSQPNYLPIPPSTYARTDAAWNGASSQLDPWGWGDSMAPMSWNESVMTNQSGMAGGAQVFYADQEGAADNSISYMDNDSRNHKRATNFGTYDAPRRPYTEMSFAALGGMMMNGERDGSILPPGYGVMNGQMRYEDDGAVEHTFDRYDPEIARDSKSPWSYPIESTLSTSNDPHPPPHHHHTMIESKKRRRSKEITPVSSKPSTPKPAKPARLILRRPRLRKSVKSHIDQFKLRLRNAIARDMVAEAKGAKTQAQGKSSRRASEKTLKLKVRSEKAVASMEKATCSSHPPSILSKMVTNHSKIDSSSSLVSREESLGKSTSSPPSKAASRATIDKVCLWLHKQGISLSELACMIKVSEEGVRQWSNGEKSSEMNMEEKIKNFMNEMDAVLAMDPAMDLEMDVELNPTKEVSLGDGHLLSDAKAGMGLENGGEKPLVNFIKNPSSGEMPLPTSKSKSSLRKGNLRIQLGKPVRMSDKVHLSSMMKTKPKKKYTLEEPISDIVEEWESPLRTVEEEKKMTGLYTMMKESTEKSWNFENCSSRTREGSEWLIENAKIVDFVYEVGRLCSLFAEEKAPVSDFSLYSSILERIRKGFKSLASSALALFPSNGPSTTMSNEKLGDICYCLGALDSMTIQLCIHVKAISEWHSKLFSELLMLLGLAWLHCFKYIRQELNSRKKSISMVKVDYLNSFYYNRLYICLYHLYQLKEAAAIQSCIPVFKTVFYESGGYQNPILSKPSVFIAEKLKSQDFPSSPLMHGLPNVIDFDKVSKKVRIQLYTHNVDTVMAV